MKQKKFKSLGRKASLPKKRKVILAIETSCDETAAAVLSYQKEAKAGFPTSPLGGEWGESGLPYIKTLSSIVKSQTELHSKMGGVVPETAARAHVKWIRPVVEKALLTAHYSLSTIDYIAITVGPGLAPSLIVGVEFAKALSFALNKAIIPVNHMAGHLYSPLGRISAKLSSYQVIKFLFPMISLIVSGGHTMLVLMRDIKNYKLVGQTVDDAAGEAFDKVAKMLGLPYPGGPAVSRLARDGNPAAVDFPRPMINAKNYNFSFSGLKTAVLYYLRDNPLTPKTYNLKPDICASFQQAVVDVLVAKTLRAAKEFKAKSISLSGGVAANQALRHDLNLKSKILPVRRSLGEGGNLKFFVPPQNLCTDNAEMSGLAAGFMLHNGYKPKSYQTIKADSNLSL